MAKFRVRLVGNPEKPNFIIEDKFKLPIFVSGNGITIYDKFDNGRSKLLQLELGKGKYDETNENTKYVIGKMIHAIQAAEKKNVYKIQLKGGLFLHDFKYVGVGNNHVPKYPIFAVHDPKIIYTEEHANEIIEKLNKDGYQQLSVVYPNLS